MEGSTESASLQMIAINKRLPSAINTPANRNISYVQAGKDVYNQLIWQDCYILVGKSSGAARLFRDRASYRTGVGHVTDERCTRIVKTFNHQSIHITNWSSGFRAF